MFREDEFFLFLKLKFNGLRIYLISKKQVCIKTEKQCLHTQFRLIIDYTIENIKSSADWKWEWNVCGGRYWVIASKGA